MGTNPTIESNEEVFLAGTFATVNGFTASDEDLLAGKETTKVRCRFYIDEAAKEPYAILLRRDTMTEVDPSEFRGGWQIDRQLGFDMEAARGANKARSAKLGFKGTGKAMEYTMSAADNTDQRSYVVGLTSLRVACERFTLGRHWPEDYTEYGKVVRSAEQQANDWTLIQQYLDQHGL
jgi:hypothetical protein